MALQARSDERIQRAILDELHTSLAVNAADVGVTVHHGIVTLVGCVDAPYERSTAESAAFRVAGVRGLANGITLAHGTQESDDADIARVVRDAIEPHLGPDATGQSGPKAHVTISVSDGWVTLGGTVDRLEQQVAVEQTVRHLPGVRRVTNVVRVEPAELPLGVIVKTRPRARAESTSHDLVSAGSR